MEEEATQAYPPSPLSTSGNWGFTTAKDTLLQEILATLKLIQARQVLHTDKLNAIQKEVSWQTETDSDYTDSEDEMEKESTQKKKQKKSE